MFMSSDSSLLNTVWSNISVILQLHPNLFFYLWSYVPPDSPAFSSPVSLLYLCIAHTLFMFVPVSTKAALSLPPHGWVHFLPYLGISPFRDSIPGYSLLFRAGMSFVLSLRHVVLSGVL